MAISLRSYNTDDYDLIDRFLIKTYQPGGRYCNWLQPRWEYMHSHPYLNESALSKIGIWEDSGDIVAVVNYEADLGDAYFALQPEYSYLKSDMIEYAEQHLYGTSDDGQKYLQAYINDFDSEFESIVKSKGYIHNEDDYETISQFVIKDQIPEITVPDGYQIKSLQDNNDFRKISRVIWRGFNHPGEPPEEEIAGKIKMQNTPNFRKDLVIVVEAPNGDFASFCGMWYEATNKFAYVEPVATDPSYRRMGLGKAAVLEGIRRCAELGATVAFVESEQQFYMDIGFEKVFKRNVWTKNF